MQLLHDDNELQLTQGETQSEQLLKALRYFVGNVQSQVDVD